MKAMCSSFVVCDGVVRFVAVFQDSYGGGSPTPSEFSDAEKSAVNNGNKPMPKKVGDLKLLNGSGQPYPASTYHWERPILPEKPLPARVQYNSLAGKTTKGTVLISNYVFHLYTDHTYYCALDLDLDQLTKAVADIETREGHQS